MSKEPPRSARLCQKSHGDCFLHATAGWLNYTHFMPSGLALVSVTTENVEFYTTIFPVAVPYSEGRKGASKQRFLEQRYLEIDPLFAQELKLGGQDLQVSVAVVSGLETCMRLRLAPCDLDDLDKLTQNEERIQFELLEHIRVVSSSPFFSFPVWIGKMAVPVRVVSMEPASASWQLLVSGRTEVEVTSGVSSVDSLSSLTSLCTPARSLSQGSDSSQGDHDSTSTSETNLSSSMWKIGQRSWNLFSVQSAQPSDVGSEVISPDTESGPEGDPMSQSSLNSSFFMSLINPLANRFSRLNNMPLRMDPPKPTIPPRSSSQSSETAPLAPIIPRGAAQSSRGTHQKTRSWSGNSLEAPLLPKYSGTPRTDAVLRVQPHSIHGPHRHGDVSLPGDASPGSSLIGAGESRWSYSRMLDAFVHPATLPELYSLCQGRRRTYLVELSTVSPPWKPNKRKKGATKTGSTFTPESRPGGVGEGGGGSRSVSRPGSIGGESDSSGGGGGLLDDNELGIYLEDVQKLLQSGKQDELSQSGTEEEEEVCRSIVLRLCFATMLRIGSGMREMIDGVDMSGRETPRSSARERRFSESEAEEVVVAVGHVLVSDIVRQQLGLRACSLARLRDVREEWRVPYGSKSPVLRLQRLGNQSKQEMDLIVAFKDWVEKTVRLSDFGAILVDGQVLSLRGGEKGVWHYCRIGIIADQHMHMANKMGHRVSYLLVSPHDIRHRNVKVEVARVRPSSGSLGLSRGEGGLGLSQGEGSSTPDPVVSLSVLDPPVITESSENFGALERLETEGMEYFSAFFSRPALSSGALLVCGPAGSGGAGCGKSSLARLLCKALSRMHVHVAIVDCTTMRGQNPQRVKKRLEATFREASWCQPSVVLLDDLDNAMPHFSDAQEEAIGEGVVSVRRTQVLIDFMSKLRSDRSLVAVLATARSRQELHASLLQCRGGHIFDKVLEITPPSLMERKAIIEAILRPRCRSWRPLPDADVRTVALRTEGYLAGDLVMLVDRAISFFELRSLQHSSSAPPPYQPHSPAKPKVSIDLSSASPPRISNSPSTGRKSSAVASMSSEFSPMARRHKALSLALSSASGSTLVAEPISRPSHIPILSLSLEDFLRALESFVPVSLRGLALHSAGPLDFSDVGGLSDAKQMLREMLLWPSKYPKLFSQCPIRQRAGVLLYGAPGTGKTLLAGAVAKEFALNFVSIKGPELLSKYIGASEQAVRDMFTRAQAAKPCILFFDEFDSLAPKRGHDRTGVTDRVVNQLLTQLDGVETLQGVYVLAATSRPDLIDPALLRPGRIDRSLLCDLPTQEERLDILRALSRGMPLNNDTHLDEIAARTQDFSGADLKALLYNAQLQSAHQSLEEARRDSKTSTEALEHRTDTEDTSSTRGGRAAVYCASGWAAKKQSNQTELEHKATVLRERANLLAGLVTLKSSELQKGLSKPKVTVTQKHLISAVSSLQPSVTPSELKKYTEIYQRFTGTTKVSVADFKQQLSTMA